jgi:hypothetical protein
VLWIRRSECGRPGVAVRFYLDRQWLSDRVTFEQRSEEREGPQTSQMSEETVIQVEEIGSAKAPKSTPKTCPPESS